MKGPIHVRCARSGELCQECKEKLEKGEASDLDIQVTRILSRVEERNDIGEIELVRSIKVGTMVFILVRSSVSKLIGKGGKILREIKRELDSKVRIVNAKSEKTVIEDMLYPVKPVYTSLVFRPGEKILKIVIPRSSTGKLPTRKETLEEAISQIIGKRTVIVEE